MAKSKSYMAAYRAAKEMVAEPGMRFEPWTRETYPGIWLEDYNEWRSVNSAINQQVGEDVEPYETGSIVVGRYRYYYEVWEYDDYIITGIELIHGRERKV